MATYSKRIILHVEQNLPNKLFGCYNSSQGPNFYSKFLAKITYKTWRTKGSTASTFFPQSNGFLSNPHRHHANGSKSKWVYWQPAIINKTKSQNTKYIRNWKNGSEYRLQAPVLHSSRTWVLQQYCCSQLRELSSRSPHQNEAFVPTPRGRS